MSPITTHVLDTAQGRPASGVPIHLEQRTSEGWTSKARGTTNDDGRVAVLLEPGTLEAGTYRLTFDTGAYFAASGTATFYPQVTVEFVIEQPTEHYHVPLLLSPFGYSTYRGS